MIVRRFLLWSKMVGASERADGVSALARAYLYGNLQKDERREALAALTSILDDPSPIVRQALADALGSAMDTPRHIAVSLANDQSEIASLVLARSPVLTDSDLIDALSIANDVAQTSIGIRPGLSHEVASVLAEVGGVDAIVALADNHSAQLRERVIMKMLKRFGDHADLRGALLRRHDIPVAARQEIAKAAAASLAQFSVTCGWLNKDRSERVARESREKATLILASSYGEELEDLMAHLRESAQLTPALILRALLSQNLAFVATALSNLTALPINRIMGLMSDRGGAGFSALYRKSGLPENLAPAFHAGVAALNAMGWQKNQSTPPIISRDLIACVIDACENLPTQGIGQLMATLRRIEAEVLRDEARVLTEQMSDEAALDTLLDDEDDAILDQIMGSKSRLEASNSSPIDDEFSFDLSHLEQNTAHQNATHYVSQHGKRNTRIEPVLMIA